MRLQLVDRVIDEKTLKALCSRFKKQLESFYSDSIISDGTIRQVDDKYVPQFRFLIQEPPKELARKACLGLYLPDDLEGIAATTIMQVDGFFFSVAMNIYLRIIQEEYLYIRLLIHDGSEDYAYARSVFESSMTRRVEYKNMISMPKAVINGFTDMLQHIKETDPFYLDIVRHKDAY